MFNYNILRAELNMLRTTLRMITVEAHATATKSALHNSKLVDESLLINARKMKPITKLSSLYEYRKWERKDLNDIMDFVLKNFSPNEPLVSTLMGKPSNCIKYNEYTIEHALQSDASFLARDIHTNKIKGVRINSIGARNGMELLEDFGPEMNAVAKFLYFAESNFQSLGDSDNYMRHIVVCVSPEAARSGVASKLNTMCINHALENNLTKLTSCCSYSWPEKLALKSGFYLHSLVDYADFASKYRHLMSKEIFNRFMSLSAAHGYARMMVKDL